jgi:hypothetical protein
MKIKRELQYSDGSISDLENKAFFAVVFIYGNTAIQRDDPVTEQKKLLLKTNIFQNIKI